MRMAKTLQARLDKANCDYDIIPHPHSATSLESARTAGVPAERVAKSVMLDDRHGNYIMAVLPANRHLDMTKVRMSGAWQLTRESGLPSLFGDCERGAVPALGDAYQIKMLLDPSLTRQGDVYLEAGDHDHLIHMSMEQYMKLVPHAEVRELLMLSTHTSLASSMTRLVPRRNHGQADSSIFGNFQATGSS